jgi:hypothetical protein
MASTIRIRQSRPSASSLYYCRQTIPLKKSRKRHEPVYFVFHPLSPIQDDADSSRFHGINQCILGLAATPQIGLLRSHFQGTKPKIIDCRGCAQGSRRGELSPCPQIARLWLLCNKSWPLVFFNRGRWLE